MSQISNLHETHSRSILKALSWRIIATCTTAVIAYLITGQIELALAIGGIEFLLKIGLYYLHERAWQLLPLGTIRHLFQWLKGQPS